MLKHAHTHLAHGGSMQRGHAHKTRSRPCNSRHKHEEKNNECTNLKWRKLKRIAVGIKNPCHPKVDPGSGKSMQRQPFPHKRLLVSPYERKQPPTDNPVLTHSPPPMCPKACCTSLPPRIQERFKLENCWCVGVNNPITTGNKKCTSYRPALA